jgi:hypothetical protein
MPQTPLAKPAPIPARYNSGHNIVATVFIQCGSGYRTSGNGHIPAGKTIRPAASLQA